MRVDDILEYWDSTRAAGHTRLVMDALSASPSAEFIFVAASQAQAKDVRRSFPRAQAMTTNSNYTELYGREKPLILDHAAMSQLVKREQGRLREMGRQFKLPLQPNERDELVKALLTSVKLLETSIKGQSGAFVNAIVEEDIPALKRTLEKYTA